MQRLYSLVIITIFYFVYAIFRFILIVERDPYLLTGREAMMAIKYLYGLGELFFDNYPHVRALLRNQEERRLNGLHGHVLSSLNPRSPFYRKGVGLN